MSRSSELVYDPCSPEKWGNVQHHIFYEFLKSYIAQKIKVNFPKLSLENIEECLYDIIYNKFKDDDFTIEEDDYVDLKVGSYPEYYSDINDIRHTLEYQEITLEGLTFPPQRLDSDPNYYKLLEPLACLVFKDCSFYCDNIPFSYLSGPA